MEFRFTGGTYTPYREDIYDYGYKENNLIHLIKKLVENRICFELEKENTKLFSIKIPFKSNYYTSYINFIVNDNLGIDLIYDIEIEEFEREKNLKKNINFNDIDEFLNHLEQLDQNSRADLGIRNFDDLTNSGLLNILKLVEILKLIYKKNYKIKKSKTGIFSVNSNKKNDIVLNKEVNGYYSLTYSENGELVYCDKSVLM